MRQSGCVVSTKQQCTTVNWGQSAARLDSCYPSHAIKAMLSSIFHPVHPPTLDSPLLPFLSGLGGVLLYFGPHRGVESRYLEANSPRREFGLMGPNQDEGSG